MRICVSLYMYVCVCPVNIYIYISRTSARVRKRVTIYVRVCGIPEKECSSACHVYLYMGERKDVPAPTSPLMFIFFSLLPFVLSLFLVLCLSLHPCPRFSIFFSYNFSLFRNLMFCTKVILIHVFSSSSSSSLFYPSYPLPISSSFFSSIIRLIKKKYK